MTRELNLNTDATTPGDAGTASMGDLLDRVLAIQPLAVETIDTPNGPTPTGEALFAYVLEITPDTDAGPGEAIDQGEQPIFWQYVRASLQDRTSTDTPWVIGRIVHLKRAYLLKGVTPEEHERAQRQIKAWAVAMRAATDAAAAAGDGPF